MNKQELFQDNLRDTHWLGEVIDNVDPNGSGRCRVKVYGKFDLLEDEDIPWAIPANTALVGSYSVPNIGEIVSIYFDNGNIYTPVYKNTVRVNSDLKSEVLDNSSNPERVSSVLYDTDKGIRIYHTQEDGLIITTGNGPKSNPAIRVSSDGKIFLSAADIYIADNLSDTAEPAVKGQTLRDLLEDLIEVLANHTHITGAGPIDPVSIMDMFFLKFKLDNIKQES